MAYSPVAYIAPYYRKFKNYWLKAYEPGTTTPKTMAIDEDGNGAAAKFQVNIDGFFVSSGDAIVTPFIDGAYDAYLFPTEAEADANDTTNAERVANDLQGVSTGGIGSIISDYTNFYFDDLTGAQGSGGSSTTKGGKSIVLKAGDAITVSTGNEDNNNSEWDIVATSVIQPSDVSFAISYGSISARLRLQGYQSIGHGGLPITNGGFVIRSDGTVRLTLTSVSGVYQVGELVAGVTSGALGNIASIDGDVLVITMVSGRFIAPIAGDPSSETVNGSTSLASGTTTQLNNWRFIDDSDHEPYLFNDIDVNQTEQYAITVHRSISTQRRISASVTPDETLALVGLCCGPSVNDDDIRIKLSAPLTVRFSATSTPAISDVSSFHSSHTEIAWDSVNYEFVLTHLACGLSAQTTANFNYEANDEYIDVAVRRVGSTEHRFSLFDRLSGTIEWNGVTWSITNREIDRNGSESGYAVSGLSAGPDYFITVTHPETATTYDDDNLIAEVLGVTNFYIVAKTKITRTGFDLQLRDPATGNIVTSLPSSLKIRFSRGWYKLPRPITGFISCALPNTRIDPADVVSATGNLWGISLERP